MLSNLDIAIFCLYKLGGTTKKIHTEKIVMECYNLAKERFSWRLPEYSSFPDKAPVRFALEQAKKNENGRLVIGKAGGDFTGGDREGWQLTPGGINWMRLNEERIISELKIERPKIIEREAARFIKRIKSDLAYKNFITDNNTLINVSKYNLIDLLNCSPDVPLEIIRSKFNDIRTIAELVNEKDILSFLNMCEIKFKEILISNR
jgi:hypothetical protein